ncbi:uncharacterized protein LOC142348373 isoform X2 [Convolutriloba macropyga]
MQCMRREWCKSYNHNSHFTTCELIITDYRLLNMSTVNGTESAAVGWRHYSKFDYVRGCGDQNVSECVQLWVERDKTSNTSITCKWTLPDHDHHTTFMTDQEFTVTNLEHLNQQGVGLPAAEVVHNLMREDREFEVIGANIPGVHYDFELNQYFGGVLAQIPLFTSESSYPASVVELSHLRVFTEHTVDIHFTFEGTAEVLDIWNEPSDGICPCSMNPIGLFMFQVSGLKAGQNYNFFLQLTSAYGKKGPITKIEQATYTDVIFNVTSSTTDMIVLSLRFESGTGSEVIMGIKGQLGGIHRKYYCNFALINSYRFPDLDPGDLYTIEMTAISLGGRQSGEGGGAVAVIRNYTFTESTFPIQPTIATTITVTQHTIHFGWTNPVFFQNIHIWVDPIGGNCPCALSNQSPNDVTITDLEAGREYETFMLAESAFGRNSSRVSFVRSLYTDTVSLNNTLSTHRLQTQVHFESGVGSTVQMDLDCSDFPLSWTQNQLFALQLLFDFDEVIPGSAYSWKITGKSQGSNPLLRTYSFSESTLPMSPIPLMEAASALDNYDTFVLTIGNQLYAERSTTTVQFSWGQERRIEEYKIKDVTLDRIISHFPSSQGWTLNDPTVLTPGMKYIYEVTTVSHGKVSPVVYHVEDSLYPLPPIENSASRDIKDFGIDLHVTYNGFVQNLKIWIVPPEGNCVVGCTIATPWTNPIQLTELRPGMEYTTTLKSESYGKESDPISFTEALMPGKIISFLNVSTDRQVILEFQLEAGVGREIKLEYTGRYTGHSSTTTYPFELFNRYVLTGMEPSESYDMTLTWKGQGVNYKTRRKDFVVHTYPSGVVVTAVQAFHHELKITYETNGSFSLLDVTVSPGGSQCPCEITEVGSGEITIGNKDTQPLTAGEEYFVYLRTSSFAGIKSSPVEIVKSLPIDTITTNTWINGQTANFEVTVESGVGSYISIHFANNISPNPTTFEDGDIPFTLSISRQAVVNVPGVCATLDLTFYSRGSEQLSSTSLSKVGLPPTGPSSTPFPGSSKVEMHFFLRDPHQFRCVFIFYFDLSKCDNFKYLNEFHYSAPDEHHWAYHQLLPQYWERDYKVEGTNNYYAVFYQNGMDEAGKTFYLNVVTVSCDQWSDVLHMSAVSEPYAVPYP